MIYIYLIFKREVANLVKRKKAEYFQNKLNENIGDPKNLWKTIKKVRFTKPKR